MGTRQITLTSNRRGSLAQAEDFLRYLFKLFPMLATPVLLGAVYLTVIQSFVLLISQDISQLKINLILQLVILITFAFWSSKKSGTYLSAPFIFVSAIWFWHSPFLTGHYLGLGGDFDYAGSVFTYGYFYVPKASALVALCLCFAVLGSLSGFVQQSAKKTKRSAFSHSGSGKRSANKLAWIAFLGFILVSFMYLIVEGMGTFGNTYMSLYTDSSNSLLYRFYQSTKFYGVIVILAVFASIKTKKAFIVAVAITVGLIFINVLMGSRSIPFIYALALLVSINSFFIKIPFYPLIVLALAASAASYVIDHTRQFGLGLQIFDFGQTGRSIDYIHIFWNSGGSIMTVLRTMEFSLESGLLYGKSIADAVIYLSPSAIVDGFGLQTGFVRPSDWIVAMSSDVSAGGGMGYSLVAEAYLNFGMIGCVLFAFIGWFIAKHFYSYVFYNNRFGALHAFNVAVIYSLHMRSDVTTYLRAIVYGFVFIEILRFMERKTPTRGVFKYNHAKDTN